MDLNLSKLLSIAIEWEHKENTESEDTRLKNVLNGALGQWQKRGKDGGALDFISFATAFRIQENDIDCSFNLLTASNKEDDKKYNTFIKLTTYPDQGKGFWPWSILRDINIMRHGNINNGTGLFPPTVLVLRKEEEIDIPLFDKAIVINNIPNDIVQCYEDHYQEENFEEDGVKKSWRWYAAYPSVLGDQIRNDGKETKYLIYILGTRREFTKRSRQKDYGLIVGLTSQIEKTLVPDAVYTILTAWNILAVAPHILEDGKQIIEDEKRILELKAIQDMTHVFKTYLDIKLNPTVESALLTVNEDQTRKIKEAIHSFDAVINLMHFVSNGGKLYSKKDGERNVESYDLVGCIANFFNHSIYQRGITVGKLETNSENLHGKWVKQAYLETILCEIVSNINREAIDNDKIEIQVKVSQANGEPYELEITVKNKKQSTPVLDDNRPSDNTEPSNNKQSLHHSGEKAMGAFFEALGGKYKGDPITYADGAPGFEAIMTYNLAAWEKMINDLSIGDDISQSYLKPDSKSEGTEKLMEDTSPPEKVSLRILLLDDEVANPETVSNHLYNIFDKNKFYIKWYKRPKLRGSFQHLFTCLGVYDENQTHIGLEIFLCQSIIDAGYFLLDTHFDIALLDIDFKKDRYVKPHHDLIPRLGGFLFGLHLAHKKNTLPFVFTAKEDDLRKDPDYKYLTNLSLGNLTIHDEGGKKIQKYLQNGFYNWCDKILPQLKPTADTASVCAFYLFSCGKKESKDFLQLESQRSQEMSEEIRNDLICILLEIDKRGEVAVILNVIACGHALVRFLFCNLAHLNQITKALNGTLNEGGDHDKQEKFDTLFKRACSLFNIENLEDFKKKIHSDGNINDKYFRINLFSVLQNDNTKTLYIFGLRDNPDNEQEQLAENIKDLVIPKSKNNQLTNKQKIKIYSFEINKKGEKVDCSKPSWRRIIEISAKRKGSSYLDRNMGGTYETIKKLLSKNVSGLEVLGPKGTLDLLSDIKVDEKNTPYITLRITVNHMPANEEMEK